MIVRRVEVQYKGWENTNLHGIEDDQPILAVWNGEGKGSGKDKSSTEIFGSHTKIFSVSFHWIVKHLSFFSTGCPRK